MMNDLPTKFGGDGPREPRDISEADAVRTPLVLTEGERLLLRQHAQNEIDDIKGQLSDLKAEGIEVEGSGLDELRAWQRIKEKLS